MERKIGEIFEFKGEYYQVCLDERETCNGCSLFQNSKCSKIDIDDIMGSCISDKRWDGNNIHFKKVSPPAITEPSTSLINPKKKLLLILCRL